MFYTQFMLRFIGIMKQSAVSRCHGAVASGEQVRAIPPGPGARGVASRREIDNQLPAMAV